MHDEKRKRKSTPYRFLCAAVIAVAGSLLLSKTGDIPAEVQAEGDYDNEYNMLDDQGYTDFGLALDDPEEFTSPYQPLQNYEPNPLSWLYVSYMNRATNDSNKGKYWVYNTMPSLSSLKATIKDPDHGIKDGELQLNPVSGEKTYKAPYFDNTRTVGTNAVAVSRGPGKDTAVVQMSIDYDNTHKKEKDYIRLTLLHRKAGGYETVTEKIFTLAAPSAFGNLDTSAMSSVAAITALDMDGDGVDEVALYIADPSRPRVQLFRVGEDAIEDYYSDQQGWEKNVIDLWQMNAPDDSHQFNKGSGSLVPIVGLSSTRISGKDTEDLVITACVPRAVSGRSKGSSIGIYGLEKDNGLKKRFLNRPEFDFDKWGIHQTLYMRYMSAQDMDVDGNGVKELAVGGIGADDTGGLEEYRLNFIIWRDNGYHMLKDTPYSIDAKHYSGMDARVTKDILPGPLPLTKAKLNTASDKDYILLDHMILEFKPGDTQTDADAGDYDVLAKGSYEMKIEMDPNMTGKWGVGSYVVQAVSGRFANGSLAGEQIAMVCSSYDDKKKDVSLSIGWLWMDNAKNIHQYNTNPEYVNRRGSAGKGTSIVLCPIANTQTAEYYQYYGKNYGWSMPTPFIATTAVPYYKELSYNGKPGNISFGFAETLTESGSAQLTLRESLNVDVSMETGIQILQEEGKIGGGGTEEGAMSLAFKAAASHGATNSITVQGDGDKEQLFVYAKPSVTYHYKKFVPRIVLTQKMIDNFESQAGHKPEKDGKELPVGYVIEEGWYDYFLTQQCPGVFNMMSMEDYAACYESYKDQGAVKVDMKELFYDYTIGDPSTYPKEKTGIKTWPIGGSATPLAQLSHRVPLDPGTGNTYTFQTDQRVSISGGIAFSLEYNRSRYLKGDVQLGLIAKADVSGQVGFGRGTVGELSGELTFGASGNMGASVSVPPTGNKGYFFETQMAAWASLSKGQLMPLIMMGFLVPEVSEDTPLPPFHPYVYETGKTWAMLAWDAPDSNNPRSADSYLIYQGDGNTALNEGAPVPAGEEHFLITGLNSDTAYHFTFAGMKD